MNPILEIKNLTKNFGGVKAVRGVDIRIFPGEVIGLIGPNGAGKTTLFNMVSGLVKPTSGEIIYSPQDEKFRLDGMRPDKIARLNIGRTFQNIRLFSRLSVIDNVRIGSHSIHGSSFIGAVMRSRKEKLIEHKVLETAKECLEFMGLSKYADEQAFNLPYGYQRRLEIARALAGEPKLLLLDEPAAGMNPSETAELKNLIPSLLKLGLTLFIIEHDMSLVMSSCKRIYVLDEGALIAEGDAKAIQQNERVIEAYLGSGEMGRSADARV